MWRVGLPGGGEAVAKLRVGPAPTAPPRMRTTKFAIEVVSSPGSALHVDIRTLGAELLILTAVEASLAGQIKATIPLVARAKYGEGVPAVAIVEQMTFAVLRRLSDHQGTARAAAPADIIK
jgi:hypothetical protein